MLPTFRQGLSTSQWQPAGKSKSKKKNFISCFCELFFAFVLSCEENKCIKARQEEELEKHTQQ